MMNGHKNIKTTGEHRNWDTSQKKTGKHVHFAALFKPGIDFLQTEKPKGLQI